MLSGRTGRSVHTERDGEDARDDEAVPILTASQWVLPYAPYTKGTKYDVSVEGKRYTCQQADVYIRKLVTHQVEHTLPAIVKGGPPGWVCTASRSRTGLAYTGQCSKPGSFTGRFFSWTVG